MKKLLAIFALVTVSLVSAQAGKGSFVVETSVLSNNVSPNTGLGYSSIKEGLKVLNVGVNGGYFFANDVALKLGVGYGQARAEGEKLGDVWSYRAGVEARVVDNFLVEAAWTGSTSSAIDYNPSYVSTQVGYNMFVTESVAIKPLIRYDISLTDHYNDVLSFGVGFGFYF